MSAMIGTAVRMDRSRSVRARPELFESREPVARTKVPGVDGPERLLELQRSAGNAAVSGLIARQRARTGERSMTLADFSQGVRRFGVTSVKTGTLEEQTQLLNTQFGAEDRLGDVLQNDIRAHNFPWASWGPGDTSPVYASILAGFEDFERGMGGVPPVSEIWFFEFGFLPLTIQGQLRVRRGTMAAEFGGGKLALYKAAEAEATQKVIPVRRDRDRRPSRAERVTRDIGLRRIVSHELGHGMQELAYQRASEAADSRPELMARYRAQVGWVQRGARERLYDIRAPGVEEALAAGTEPDARFEITKENWDQGFREQPVSKYSVTESFEDFGEAVMAYVQRPARCCSRGHPAGSRSCASSELFSPETEETEAEAEGAQASGGG